MIYKHLGEGLFSKGKVLLGLVLGLSQAASGQPSSNGPIPLPVLTHIVPPSPTAAALGRYGDIPLSLYTGVPSISIPLLNVKNSSGSGNLPISLSYHASGIRVNDIASWVGLGWSLNCGGVVSRTMHGKPDEHPLGYLHDGGTTLSRYLDCTTGNGTFGPDEQWGISRDVANGVIDTEPDTYNFNIGGTSGQFVFDLNKNPVLIPQQSVLIEARTDTSGFKITGEDGTIYQFLSAERTRTITVPNRVQPAYYPSSWYLTRITPVVGHAIKFIYNTPVRVAYPANDTENKLVALTGGAGTVSPGRIQVLPSLTTVYTDVLTLKEIVAYDQTVKFFSSARFDIVGMTKLDSIVQYNNKGNSVKRFYLTLNSTGRPYLTELQEVGAGTTRTNPYRFQYDSPLPALYSKQQDHWGYANRNSASTLIPPFQLTAYTLSSGTTPPPPIHQYSRSLSKSRLRFG